MVRSFQGAVPDDDGNLRLQVESCPEWLVVEHFFDEGCDDDVLRSAGQGGQRLSSLHDVCCDLAREIRFDGAPVGQHAGEDVVAVLDHESRVRFRHLHRHRRRGYERSAG
jgi:hypothetical protein